MQVSVLMALPDLTPKMTEKINGYETILSKYNSLNSEVQELQKKQDKEFGLNDKLMKKLEDSEKKLEEMYQNVLTYEDNLRYWLFNEQKMKNLIDMKLADEDTFVKNIYVTHFSKMTNILTVSTKKSKKMTNLKRLRPFNPSLTDSNSNTTNWRNSNSSSWSMTKTKKQAHRRSWMSSKNSCCRTRNRSIKTRNRLCHK